MKLLGFALLFALTAAIPSCSYAQMPQTSTTKAASPTASKKAADTTSTPSAQEISDAKAKGMVWVNTSTRVYHKDGTVYGTTKHGKFMTEEDAKKAGYRAAKASSGKSSKKSASSK